MRLLLDFAANFGLLIGSIDGKLSGDKDPTVDLNRVAERRHGLWRGVDHMENWADHLLVTPHSPNDDLFANIEFETIPEVKDPWKELNPAK